MLSPRLVFLSLESVRQVWYDQRMKTLRPLLVGIVVATLGIIAYTTWQLARVRGGAQAGGSSPGR